MTNPLVTVGIPLYRSARFVDNVLASIAAMPAEGVEILVSDRHLADDALQRIADATRDDPRVRCMAARDEINWVEHINLLMREARGRYWRFLPHDDYAPPGSLEALVEVMEADSTLLVAYAATRAEELSGDPKPERDVREAHPDTSAGQVYGHALDLVGGGHFTGAFKGLIRLAPIRARGLFIRPNVDLIGSERLWLFALALVGRFRFVPESLYIKRYHPRSVHSSWQARTRHRLGALRIMREYLGDLHPDNEVRRLAFAYLGWASAHPSCSEATSAGG